MNITEEKKMGGDRPKYWLHRITGGKNARTFAYDLLHDHCLLSIGWSDFSSLDLLKDIKDDKGESKLNKLILTNWKLDHLPKSRFALLRFINGMKTGEIVVVPQWGGEFSICRIISDKVITNETLPQEYYADKGVTLNGKHLVNKEGETIDVGFYREIEFVEKCKNISRYQYANQNLTSRMKIRQTNSEITKIQNAVKFSIQRIQEGRPIDIKGDLSQVSIEHTHKAINELFADNKYELIVEKYLRAIGADKIIKPAKNESKTEDGDADRIAVFDAIKVKIYVQVKKHRKDSTTGDWAVKQIEAYCKTKVADEYTAILWVISNANDFSEEAKQHAKNAKVRLINGEEFARMILDVGLKYFE